MIVSPKLVVSQDLIWKIRFVTVGKHTVSEHSCSRRPLDKKLSISANALVATSTKCDHIVLPCTIASKETKFNTFAMADSGATASFIDFLFAQLHGLKLIPMQHPRDLTVADGRIISLGAITHTVCIAIASGAHRKVLELFITRLGQYPVVLGLLWLQKHDPHIRFRDNTITFDSEHCLEHCITTHQSMTICGVDHVFDTLHKHETLQTSQEIPHKIIQTHKIHKTCRTHETLLKTHETTPKTHEIYETRRSTAPKPRYSPCSSYRIDMAECTRKID